MKSGVQIIDGTPAVDCDLTEYFWALDYSYDGRPKKKVIGKTFEEIKNFVKFNAYATHPLLDFFEISYHKDGVRIQPKGIDE